MWHRSAASLGDRGDGAICCQPTGHQDTCGQSGRSALARSAVGSNMTACVNLAGELDQQLKCRLRERRRLLILSRMFDESDSYKRRVQSLVTQTENRKLIRLKHGNQDIDSRLAKIFHLWLDELVPQWS